MKLRARITRTGETDENVLLAAMRQPIPATFALAPVGAVRVLQFNDEFFDVEVELDEGVSQVSLDVGRFVVGHSNGDDRTGAASAAERSEGSRSK